MSVNDAIDKIYNTFDGPSVAQDYHERHGTPSLCVITVGSPQEAAEVVRPFRHEVAGRSVVEIGGGVGFLALELARHAQSVVSIEVDPAWSWVFTKYLYAQKPPNLTWVFGKAESVADWLRADVAILRTRSGVRQMVDLAERMAETIILSACEEPLVAPRGDRLLRDITGYIDRRVCELMVEFEAAAEVRQ